MATRRLSNRNVRLIATNMSTTSPPQDVPVQNDVQENRKGSLQVQTEQDSASETNPPLDLPDTPREQLSPLTTHPTNSDAQEPLLHNNNSRKIQNNFVSVMEFVGKLTTTAAKEPRMSLDDLLASMGYIKDVDELASGGDDDDFGDTTTSFSLDFSSSGDTSSSVCFGSPLRKSLSATLLRFSSELAHRCWIENNPHLLSREQQEAREAGVRPKKAEVAELQKVMVPWRGESAILFIDLSGYSKIAAALTDKGGAHALSSAVNLYFESLLAIVVTQFGGSPGFFAGDAVCCFWPCSSVRKPLEVCLSACACALELQRRAGTSRVEGTDLTFGIHCSVAFGDIESTVFRTTASENNMAAYHFVSGFPLVQTSALLNAAKVGQTVISDEANAMVKQYANTTPVDLAALNSPSTMSNIHKSEAAEHANHKASTNNNNFSSSNGSNNNNNNSNSINSVMDTSNKGHMLISLDDEYRDVLDNQVTDLRIQRSPWLEKSLVPVSVSSKLKQGFKAAHIAEMRFLCVLFVRKNVDTVSPEAWFYETHQILDECRCPIVQILHDDKGTHLIAAVGLYHTEKSPATTGILAARKLWERDTGCVVGVACGEVFCGITGSDVACRWDITGPACVRAARLMQHGVERDQPVVIDASVAAFTEDDSQLEAGELIRLKGSPLPTRVYSLVKETVSVTAGISSMKWSSLTLHAEQREKLAVQFLSHKYQRCLALVSGPVGSGKKTLITMILDLMHFTNLTHYATRDKTPLRIITTLADWFSHHLDDELATLGRHCREHLNNGRITQSLNLAHRAINTFIEKDLVFVFVVAYIHLLDSASVDFIKSVVSATPTKGRGRFLIVTTAYPLWGFPSPKDLISELSRPLKENARMKCTLSESDSALVQTDLVSVDVPYATDPVVFADAFQGANYWKPTDAAAKILTKATGGCLMLIDPIIQACRAQSFEHCSENLAESEIREKSFLPATIDGLTHITPAGEDFFIHDVNWKRIAPNITARFLELYDAFPPRLQLLLRILASLATVNGNAMVGQVIDLSLKLNSKFTRSRLEHDIELLKENGIIRVPEDDDGDEICFSVPAMIDTVIALLTPEQDKMIKRQSFKFAHQLWEEGFEDTDGNFGEKGKRVAVKQAVPPSFFPITVTLFARVCRAAGENSMYRQRMKEAWSCMIEVDKNGEHPEIRQRLESRIFFENRRFPDLCNQELFAEFDIQPKMSRFSSRAHEEFMKMKLLPKELNFMVSFQSPMALGALGAEMECMFMNSVLNLLDFNCVDTELIPNFIRQQLPSDVDAFISATKIFDEMFPAISAEEAKTVTPLESQLRLAPKPGTDPIFENFVPPKNYEDEHKLVTSFLVKSKSYEDAEIQIRTMCAYYNKVLIVRRDRANYKLKHMTSIDEFTNCVQFDKLQKNVKKAFVRLIKETITSNDIHHALLDLATTGYQLKAIDNSLQTLRDDLLRKKVATVEDFKSHLISFAVLGDEITYRPFFHGDGDSKHLT